jgi:GNAT superfamily N-acetyltransferase
MKISRKKLKQIIKEELVKEGLLDTSELELPEKERLLKYIDAADQHPEFSGYNLVKGVDRDKRRLAITDDDGRVVGFMTPHKDRGYWRTGAIYTDPNARGKGYARKAIIEFFSNPKHRPARVWIADINRQSQRAFTGAGFVKGDRRDIGEHPDEKGHDYYLGEI